MTARPRVSVTVVYHQQRARPSCHVSSSESPNAGEHGPAATSPNPTGPRCPSGRLQFSIIRYLGHRVPSAAWHDIGVIHTTPLQAPSPGGDRLPLSQQPVFRCWPLYEPVNCEKTPVTGDHSWRFSAQGRLHSHTTATSTVAGGTGESGGLTSGRSPQGVRVSATIPAQRSVLHPDLSHQPYSGLSVRCAGPPPSTPSCLTPRVGLTSSLVHL